MTSGVNEKGERPCPVCQPPMEVRKRGKVEIDACEEHGVWLDRGELEAIEERIAVALRVRSNAKARRELETAKRDGKLSGIVFGWFALLMD